MTLIVSNDTYQSMGSPYKITNKSNNLVADISNLLGQLFTRKEYCQLFKTISSATASRDLKRGVSEGNLKKYGEKNQTQYKFLKRKI